MTDSQLAIRPDQTTWNEAQLQALRALDIVGASRADLDIFFHRAKASGLDPFAKQIYMLGRNTKDKRTQQWVQKFTIQTGIDGYRIIARRAANAAGEAYGEPEVLFCGPDGEWRDSWLVKEAPAAAKVVVERYAVLPGSSTVTITRFPAVARFDEYGQTDREGKPTGMWRNMPSNQLAKCAEALALRKAFPEDLSGIYVEEEMQQATNTVALVAESSAPAPAGDLSAEVAAAATLEVVQELWRRAVATGLMTDDLKNQLARKASEFAAAGKRTQPVPGAGQISPEELSLKQQEITATRALAEAGDPLPV